MNNIDCINQVISHFFEAKISGYLISSKDEYQGEYTSEYTNRIKFLTGFTGSYAIVILFHKKGLFFTDGRYLTQAAKEINTTFFDIVNVADLANFDFSIYNITSPIGYDPKLFTKEFLKFFSSLNLLPIKQNLIDNIWVNRPLASNKQCYLYPEKYAGKSWQEKLMLTKNAKGMNNYLFLTNSESICWLLNIRAADQEFCPILNSYALISDNDVSIFANLNKIPQEIIDHFYPEITFLEIDLLATHLSKITEEILVDKQTTSEFFENCLNKAKIKYSNDITLTIRAEKTDVEISWFIQRHIEDAVALCELFSYLDELVTSGESISEYNLSLKLTSFRKQNPNYISDSFPNICGYNQNGAIIHYRPLLGSSKLIQPEGILLIDSGGHYWGATTDVTRTICLSNATEKQKYHYTLVLKGHIALASATFAKGATGANLDILARQYLWNCGLDYGHGTGHGVGNCLNVHEGPHSISGRNNVSLKAGMITSNEPGYYIPENYGIRIENLCHIVQSQYPGFLKFENLTLLPYDSKLIDKNLLTKEECHHISQYYSDINTKVSPLLSNSAKKWLAKELAFFN